MNQETAIYSLSQSSSSTADSIWTFLNTIKAQCDHYASVIQPTMEQNFFGFSEFLTGFAILMIAWTTTDYKFQFRIQISKFPQKTLYIIAIVIGAIALVCDFLSAIEILCSLVHLIIQLICAAVLFSFVVYWMTRAFLKPPIFNQSNCERYKTEFFRVCDYGTDEELNVITQEMSDSVDTLVDSALDYEKDKESKSSTRKSNLIL